MSLSNIEDFKTRCHKTFAVFGSLHFPFMEKQTLSKTMKGLALGEVLAIAFVICTDDSHCWFLDRGISGGCQKSFRCQPLQVRHSLQ